MTEKRYVLICEDDKILNEKLSEEIIKHYRDSDLSIEVFSVNDKKSALDTVDSRYFSAALVDLNLDNKLPLDWRDTDGIKVIEKIVSKDFGTKIIIMSANPLTDLVFDLTKKFNIVDYLTKGNSIDSFSNIVRSAIVAIDSAIMMKPENIYSDFIGESGEKRIILESSILDNLFFMKSQQDHAIKKIVNKIYPFEYRNNDRLIVDGGYKFLNSVLWSYKYASYVGVRIKRENDSNDESLFSFKDRIKEEIFSKEMHGVCINIYTLKN